jgi:hypothetical protein
MEMVKGEVVDVDEEDVRDECGCGDVKDEV